MSSKRDYYEVLGVEKSSSTGDIKSQYRKLALKFHPDRNKSPDAAEHFKEISEAYAVLSDSDKRKTYDQYGHQGIDGQYSQQDIFRGANFDDLSGSGGFESIFENLFSGGGGRGGFGSYGQRRGSDLLYETQITLEDVLHGKELNIDVKKDVPCKVCSGSGCKPGTSKAKCGQCHGQGQIRQQRRMGFASFITAMPCNSCHGQGTVITDPCRSCHGQGKTRGSKNLNFKIPAGIQTGNYVVIQGEGEFVSGGASGDLIVRIHVMPHPKFKYDGADLFYDLDVTVVDAALGAETLVPTLDGNEKIKIDEGTQPNSIKKLRGKGLPHPGSRGRGDLHVRFVVHIPKKLDKKQKKLLRDFEQTLG